MDRTKLQGSERKRKVLINARHLVLFSSLGIFFFILFALFTIVVRTDALRQFDFNTTVRLQDDIPLSVDGFFSALSLVGRFEYTFVFLLIFLAVSAPVAHVWLLSNKTSRFTHYVLKIVGGIAVIGLFGFAHVIEIIGKSFLNQPGPPRMFLRSQFLDFPGLHVFTEASYPSGHSMRVVFLAILIGVTIYVSKKLNKPTKLVISLGITGFVFLMLLSRISLGEHWTTDVIGGALLGASFAFFSLLFL